VPEPGFIQQALDIPIGQTAYVGADHQRFQWPRTDDAADVRDYSTHEALDRTAHLRHGDSDLALGGLDRLVTAAIARAGRRRHSLVACSTQERRDLVFNGAL
jgi:hypothetical protein